MLFFLKAAATVFAAATSLLGLWQVAVHYDLPFFRTISSGENLWEPSTNSDLAHANQPSAFFENENASIPFCHTDCVFAPVVDGEIDSDFDQASGSYDQAAQNEQPWEAASASESVIKKLASFDSVLDYLFSFVEKQPKAALAMLQFTLVGTFIAGLVFAIGGACYWALRLLDLRGHNVPTAPKLLNNDTVITLPAFESNDHDALAFISNIVTSVSSSMVSPDNNSPLAETILEACAFATEIANARSKTLEGKLREEISKSTGDMNTKLDAVAKERKHLAQNLDTKLDAVAQGSKDYAQSLVGKLNAKVHGFNERVRNIDSKFDVITGEMRDSVVKFESLKSKIDSKANADVVSELDQKLDQLAADIKTVAQPEAVASMQKSEFVSPQAVAELQASIHSVQNDLSKLRNDIEDFKIASGEESEKKAANELFNEKIMQMEKSHKAEIEELRALIGSTQQEVHLKTGNLEMSIKKQQGDMNNLLKSKADARELNTMKNSISGFVNNRQLQDVKEQVDVLSSRADSNDRAVNDIHGTVGTNKKTIDQVRDSLKSKADASEVAILTGQIANKVEDHVFDEYKTQIGEQISTFVTKECDDLKKVVVDGQEDIKAVKEAMTKSQSDLGTFQEQLAEKAKVDDMKNLEKTISNVMSHLNSIENANALQPESGSTEGKATEVDLGMEQMNIDATIPLKPSDETINDKSATVATSQTLPAAPVNVDPALLDPALLDPALINPAYTQHAPLPTFGQPEWAEAPTFTPSNSMASPSSSLQASQWSAQPLFDPSQLDTREFIAGELLQDPNLSEEERVALALGPDSSMGFQRYGESAAHGLQTPLQNSSWADNNQGFNPPYTGPQQYPDSGLDGFQTPLQTSSWADNNQGFNPAITTPQQYPESGVHGFMAPLQNSVWADNNQGFNPPSTAPQKYPPSGVHSFTPLQTSSWADNSQVFNPSNRAPQPCPTSDVQGSTFEAPLQTSSLADNSQGSDPPKGPKSQRYPPRQGPGPNGGKRRVTPGLREHNRCNAIRNTLKKVLQNFPEEQRKHALSFQNPVSLRFEFNSKWAWLNQCTVSGAMARNICPPAGWVAPVATDPWGPFKQEGESQQDGE